MFKITSNQETLLKKDILDSEKNISQVKENKVYSIDRIISKQNKHTLVKLSYLQGTWWIYDEHWVGLPTQIELFTVHQFKACFPGASEADITLYYLPLLEACSLFRINTPLRLAAFFAQIGHESGSLKYKQEIASGSAYEGRRDLGNIYIGDGVKYKGRGLIQLTGRANYLLYGALLGLDLINYPGLALNPTNAAKLACVYWQRNNLNKFADSKAFDKITKKINGGLNGKKDRDNRYQNALQVFGVK